MRGRVTDWKDDRGFGFIEPESGGERLFFHISGMARGAPRPSVGDSVSYEMAASPNGKPRAVGVGPAGLAAVSNVLMSKRVALSVAAILVFPVLWWLLKLGKFPLLLFWVFAGMSSVAFIMYGLDKWAAKREAQRTPENTLQVCALLGGWPGALLAQQVFRHKSSKRSFQVTFWFMAVLNCGALGFLLSPTSATLIRQLLEAR
jgi:uncharacterized membrane protein YsdA (DUF1294 family)/cold shock CspA family protein